MQQNIIERTPDPGYCKKIRPQKCNDNAAVLCCDYAGNRKGSPQGCDIIGEYYENNKLEDDLSEV